MAYVQIYESNDVNVVQDKLEHMSYLRLYVWKVDHVLSVSPINGEKQQFAQVFLHPPAARPAQPLLFCLPCLLSSILTITVAMSLPWIQPAPFWCSPTEWQLQHIHKRS